MDVRKEGEVFVVALFCGSRDGTHGLLASQMLDKHDGVILNSVEDLFMVDAQWKGPISRRIGGTKFQDRVS